MKTTTRRVFIRRSCIRVRRIVRRSGVIVETKKVVETSVVSFVPSIMNDTIVHHAHVTPTEIVHVAADNITVSSMTALAMMLMRLI